MVIQQVSRWLAERKAQVVVGFLAMGDEIDMTPLVDAHPDIRFGLTRTAPGITLTVHHFDAPREVHRFGFEQPVGDAPVIPRQEIDVVLVPGLAFSIDGRRLGRGAGYYDRFLAGLDAAKVALTTSDRIRDDLPLEPHDVRVDWIATETGVYPARGASDS
jgi:5-formyltetrahydrofolate cyclo-ligase